MKHLLVRSLPLKMVIQNLAEAMNTSYDERCDQYILKLTPEFGTGTITGIDFESGMGIIQYDCTFADDTEIKFIVNKIHPLKFLFCLEGTMAHCFQHEDEKHEINQYQNAMVASSRLQGHILHFKKNEPVKINSLELARKDFQEKTICELQSLSPQTRKIFNDINAERKVYHEGYYSLELSDVFSQMQKFQGQDFLKKLFLEGKSYLILTRQIQQFEDDLKDYKHQTVLRKHELDRVKHAANLINQDIDRFSSIKEIIAEVGLNGNKLQGGFQLLYGSSVNQYIQNQRIRLAKTLLEGTDKSISEISDIIGLNSRSYFSKIFREEYGVTPSELRMKNSKRRNGDK